MDHVPRSPPRDHRCDAEGSGLASLLVDDSRVGNLKVPNRVVALTWRDPVGVLSRHLYADERRSCPSWPKSFMCGTDVQCKVLHQSVLKVP